MPPAVEVVLFDLGGVLVEVPGVDAMLALSGLTTADDVWRRWLTCPWVRSFESGACSEDEFAVGLISEWRLPVTPRDFLQTFQAWPSGPFAGAEVLVHETRAVVPVGCLSNTNASHWDRHMGRWPLVALFDHLFLSFQTGLLKPDAAAYSHAASCLGVPAERIVFIDDNPMNVKAALGAGMRAVHARGVEEARAQLVEAGVLEPS